MIEWRYQTKWLTETHLLIDFQQTKTENAPLNLCLAQLAENMRTQAPSQIRQLVSAAAHIMIELDVLTDTTQFEPWLKAQLQAFSLQTRQPKLWNIPVQYQGEDLNTLSQQLNLSIEQIIKLHSQTLWQVQALGFAPGFAYMGDAPPALRLPRRATPRTQVPAGAVAIAENYSAIYPIDSPGGWHIIGYTDFKTLDWTQTPPGCFNPGDQIQFIAANPL
ncbi:allophanate hydrolase subunit 1 [Thiomicrospira microaerophila]|uniref:5-oxoprolinase subunit B family protein n=1 Tax=Thiomicrospira microaerophila TaxID=406020 RepID=UPI00200E5AB9|nr:allophanate hydrolase subunit 1 [Thiomicrospira microaerophila]UQB41284.1 allophanate hydrolase subunit 1 [Thiomicrospira microaerophila]